MLRNFEVNFVHCYVIFDLLFVSIFKKMLNDFVLIKD